MKMLSPRVIYKEDVIEYMEEVEEVCINFWKNYVEKDIEPNIRIKY